MRLTYLLLLLSCSGPSAPPLQETAAAPVDETRNAEPREPSEGAGTEEAPDVAGNAAEAEVAPPPRSDSTDSPPVAQGPAPLVVFLALRVPTLANQSALIEALRNDGMMAEAEGDEVVLIIPREDFERHFRARIGTSTTGASASDRMITLLTLERYRVPRSLRRWIESVYFDPQR